jgi:hypothetical protein
MPRTSYIDRVHALLHRSHDGVRHVRDAVGEHWAQVHTGPAPPGRSAAELAMDARLAAGTVYEIELLVQLDKEVNTAVNKFVLRGRPTAWERVVFMRLLRRAVKQAERTASRIVADLGEPKR